MSECNALELRKYDKKSWFKSVFLGFFIGLAVIIPGVSGSTVAIVFKLYDEFLYAVGNLFKKFKPCFTFLLPIGIGAVIGVLLGFLVIQKLLEIVPFAVICLFAGLMLGSFPAVKDELNGVTMNVKRIVLLVVGACIPIAASVYSSVDALQGGVTANILEADMIWKIILPVCVGFIVALIYLVPGLSASAALMVIGWYTVLMDNLHFNAETLQNTSLMIVLAGLAIGAVVGFFMFSKFLSFVFSKARGTSYSVIVGLALGSMIAMFFNSEMIAVYSTWGAVGLEWWYFILGVAMLAVGVFVGQVMVRTQRKQNQ